jgi:glutamate synthase (NADPH/NADH) small chain
MTCLSLAREILAKDKHVIVIGGGDTGADCVGTSIRHRARSVTQIEILPRPPEQRSEDNPWPYWPNILRKSTSHEEGCERLWSVCTRRFTGKNGTVEKIELLDVDWKNENDRKVMLEKKETLRQLNADLVLISMGFTQPIHEGLPNLLKLEYDPRGNIKVSEQMMTTVPKVFAAGDAVSGASLVVRAMQSGRKAAKHIHAFLMKE